MTAPEQTREQIARVTRNAYETVALHPYWERAAADAIMSLPGVRDGQAAKSRLGIELSRHYGKRWSPESETTVCAAGCGAFPCATWSNLGGGAQ